MVGCTIYKRRYEDKTFFFFFISLPYETYRKDEKVKNKKLKKSDIWDILEHKKIWGMRMEEIQGLFKIYIYLFCQKKKKIHSNTKVKELFFYTKVKE